MIAICCIVSCNMVANAGNNKPISVNALPAKVQTLLSQHFNGQKVMLVTIESGVVSRSYDVFYRMARSWSSTKREILQRSTASRTSFQLIPQAIRNYLKDNYAGQSVKKIEMNKNEYEVELVYGFDLTFNKHFQLIDID